ncbi:type II toxin-antitoxin system HicB family antitoxin [Cardiobacteriaceae bacterium TAE3-ERU3]|nr:type II toxin-antitoxin system HicB family antitoxin [Cardiobacteriaceae bacterium TAE3-ERU3]
MKKIKIPIVIFKDDNCMNYGVVIPDVPGVFPVGDTIEDAIEDSKSALTAHLECMKNERIPLDLTKLRSIEDLTATPDFSDALCWTIIEMG